MSTRHRILDDFQSVTLTRIFQVYISGPLGSQPSLHLAHGISETSRFGRGHFLLMATFDEWISRILCLQLVG